MSPNDFARGIWSWFGTLAGRLAILLILGLVLAQGATIFYLIEDHERERALGIDRNFFATLARASRALAALPAEERPLVVRSMSGGNLHYWIAPSPAVGPSEGTLLSEAPPLPDAWARIPSPDKRASWHPDRRPLSMKYRVFDPPEPPPGPFGSADGSTNTDAPGTTDAGFEPGFEKPRPEKPRAGRPRGPDGRPEFRGDFRAPGGRRQQTPAWELVSGDPAYGAAAARRPRAGFDSPPIRWRAAVLLPDGDWLNAEYGQMAGLPLWVDVLFQQNLIVFLFTGSVIFLGVGLTTVRLRTLAQAADRVGRGDTLEPIEETGTREVRGLTQAFNTMSLRLRRFIEGRTQMLGAISHDLRTPITGLRLRAELVDDEENRTRMLAIIDELHHLTEATLALAREDSVRERTDRVDITALIEGICDDLADLGMDVACTAERGVSTTCRPFSLRRAIRNLAENGVKYGQRARITLKAEDRQVLITVDDDGPGIPEDQIEKALLPFVRLEASRSRETGGAGLGLTIARSIILNHGGELKLANRPGGGLRASVALPRDL